MDRFTDILMQVGEAYSRPPSRRTKFQKRITQLGLCNSVERIIAKEDGDNGWYLINFPNIVALSYNRGTYKTYDEKFHEIKYDGHCSHPYLFPTFADNQTHAFDGDRAMLCAMLIAIGYDELIKICGIL